LIGQMGREKKHRQKDDDNRQQQQKRGRRPVPTSATDQSLIHWPCRVGECRAEQNRGRERFHDRQHADKEADDEQHENAALDNCHPRGTVLDPLFCRLATFIWHGRGRTVL
jgi:hypothetical protein